MILHQTSIDLHFWLKCNTKGTLHQSHALLYLLPLCGIMKQNTSTKHFQYLLGHASNACVININELLL